MKIRPDELNDLPMRPLSDFRFKAVDDGISTSGWMISLGVLTEAQPDRGMVCTFMLGAECAAVGWSDRIDQGHALFEGALAFMVVDCRSQQFPSFTVMV
jgi:hypothetical protein